MTISVVISSYRGNEALVRACIESLNRQITRPDEIILVVDTEQERISFSQYLGDISQITLRTVFSGKKGLAAARNKGIEVSSGDIIAFIDDDAIADENWLTEILKAFHSAESVAIVGGQVLPMFEGRQIDQSLYWIIGCTSKNPPTTRPIGCNMAIKKEVFKEIGMYDEHLGRVKDNLAIGEETELFLRVTEKIPHAYIRYQEDAIVYHRVPKRRTSLSYILKRAYEEGASKAIISKVYSLNEEKKYLIHYFRHVSPLTIMVVFAVGAGYLKGKLSG
jgi:GT2 family glycosyltransferase